MRSTFIILYLLMLCGISQAQVQDSTAYRKSIIKLNLTSRFLYNSAYVVAYERMMKPNQSLEITVGYSISSTHYPWKHNSGSAGNRTVGLYLWS